MIQVKKCLMNGKFYYEKPPRKCTCDCHEPGRAIVHFMPCCGIGDDPYGWIIDKVFIWIAK